MDPKMRLQYCLNEFNTHEGLEGSRQALRKTFCVLDEWGPSHERMYLVGCYINEQLIAQAQSPPHLPLCIAAFASPSNLRRICAASPPHLLRFFSCPSRPPGARPVPDGCSNGRGPRGQQGARLGRRWRAARRRRRWREQRGSREHGRVKFRSQLRI